MPSSARAPSLVSERYAKAFIELADEKKSLKAAEGDINALAEMIEKSEDFKGFLLNPVFNKDAQADAINAIAKKAKLDKLTQNFLGTLVENKRLNILADIVTAAQAVLASRRGDVTAQVETAVALTPEQTKQIKTNLSEKIGKGIVLEPSVNPDILGGMVVTIGSQMIDDSVRRKLERIKITMGQGVNETTLKAVS